MLLRFFHARAVARRAAWILVLVAGAAGCTVSHRVTPWLRTRVHHPFVLLAESGGPKTTAVTERRREGRWIAIADTAWALALDGGRRAAYAGDRCQVVIGDAVGAEVTLPCAYSDAHLLPGGDAFACVRHVSWNDPARDVPVEIELFALDGTVRSHQRAVLPAGTLRADFFLYYVGVLPSGEVVLNAHIAGPLRDDGWRDFECTPFVVRGDRVEPLGPSIQSEGRCDSAADWSRRLGLRIRRGPEPR